MKNFRNEIIKRDLRRAKKKVLFDDELKLLNEIKATLRIGRELSRYQFNMLQIIAGK